MGSSCQGFLAMGSRLNSLAENTGCASNLGSLGFYRSHGRIECPGEFWPLYLPDPCAVEPNSRRSPTVAVGLDTAPKLVFPEDHAVQDRTHNSLHTRQSFNGIFQVSDLSLRLKKTGHVIPPDRLHSDGTDIPPAIL